MKTLTAFLASALFLMASSANAGAYTPTAWGSVNSVNNINAFTDGAYPAQGGQWQTNTTWWTGTASQLFIDFGSVVTIADILVSVDNNDDYGVVSSLDGIIWTSLFNITSNLGEVNVSPGGMDTMSTLLGHSEYIAALDFTSVQAQYIGIAAVGGDNLYSVGELQAFGPKVSAVPLPAAAFMFAPALLGFMGLRRRAKT